MIRKKKLLIPELSMKVLDLRDPQVEAAFLKALKEQGIPCGAS